MGEHFKLIPEQVYKVQMIVRDISNIQALEMGHN